MRLGFREKLLGSYLGLVGVTASITLLFLSSTLSDDLMRQLDQRLEAQADGAARWVSLRRAEHGGADQGFDRQASRLKGVVGSWVTIIDPEGKIAGDSDLTRGDAGLDPLSWPEIQAARRGEVGRATRFTEHLGADVYFVAVPASGGAIVRLGVPLGEIEATEARMRSRLYVATLLGLGAAIALGLFAAAFFVRPLRTMTRAAEALAQGDYDVTIERGSPDEFGSLATTLNLLAAELRSKISELVRERDRLSAILAGMVEGVVVTDDRGVVVLANPSAGKLLSDGVGPPLEGRALSELVPPPTQGTRVREIALGGRWILATSERLDERGVSEVLVLHDVTERRQLELRQRDFVANVSHELRTPVASVQGYAETLLAKPLDEPTAREFLEVIHRQAERMGRLVQDLLRLAELEARPPGEGEALSPVSLADIGARVVETVGTRARAAQVTLSLELAEAPPVRARAAELEQVVENLVDNAIKYGRPAGTVTLKAEPRGKTVVLSVLDQGPGIAPEHLPHLFERFYRVERDRSKKSGGTGLGLAIVERLVLGMGGTVGAESKLGVGSRFWVELPSSVESG